MDVGTKLCDHDVVRRQRNPNRELDPFKVFDPPGQKRGYPPTWTTLFKVLRDLDLQKLSKKVEEFLARMLSSWL